MSQAFMGSCTLPPSAGVSTGSPTSVMMAASCQLRLTWVMIATNSELFELNTGCRRHTSLTDAEGCGLGEIFAINLS